MNRRSRRTARQHASISVDQAWCRCTSNDAGGRQRQRQRQAAAAAAAAAQARAAPRAFPGSCARHLQHHKRSSRAAAALPAAVDPPARAGARLQASPAVLKHCTAAAHHPPRKQVSRGPRLPPPCRARGPGRLQRPAALPAAASWDAECPGRLPPPAVRAPLTAAACRRRRRPQERTQDARRQ